MKMSPRNKNLLASIARCMLGILLCALGSRFLGRWIDYDMRAVLRNGEALGTSIASNTPLLPEPFGPESANVMLPPAGAEKTFTKSSAFSFFVSGRSFLSCILPASTSFDSASLARNLAAICC